MTTIAYKNGVMAADSRSVKGTTISTVAEPKINVPFEGDYWEINGVKVLAFGFAGQATQRELIKDYLRRNLTDATRHIEGDKISFQALIVDENGQVWDWSVSISHKADRIMNQLVPVTSPFTIGSGGVFALAAMAVGVNARGAVRVASKLDTHTDNNIITWSFPGKPDVPSVRPANLQPVVAEQTA